MTDLDSGPGSRLYPVEVRIELLCLEECPSRDAALQHLQEALRLEGISDRVAVIPVKSEEEARAVRLVGSPTIRIDGVDIEGPQAEERGYGLGCRIFECDGGASGWPSVAQIRGALQKAKRNSSDGAAMAGMAAAGAGAATTAALAGACCLGPSVAPLFVATLGAGGVVTLTSLQPYSPYVLAGSALLIGRSFWTTYRRGCGAGRRVLFGLWAAAGLWLAAVGLVTYSSVRG